MDNSFEKSIVRKRIWLCSFAIGGTIEEWSEFK
jgi:hypothetical protein